jgi:hypothetical protein
MLTIETCTDERRHQVLTAFLTDLQAAFTQVMRSHHAQLTTAGLTMAAYSLQQDLEIALADSADLTI